MHSKDPISFPLPIRPNKQLPVRFRNGMRAQGQSIDSLPFKAMWYPYGTYVALAANIFLVFFQGYTAFLNPFSATDFVTNYVLLPVFVLLVLGYKFWKKTKWVRLEDMDIWSGRRAELEEDADIKGGRMWRRARDVVIG